ncbi:transferase [Syncephalis fuscata]|nr:transferase [Syncephalis fuscata]
MILSHKDTWVLPDNYDAAQTHPLSHADYIPGPNCIQNLTFYKNSQQKTNFMPAEVLIESLRKALEQYPIVCGQIVRLESNAYEVQPSSKGVLYTEAQVDDDISKFEPDWPQKSISSELQAIEPWTVKEMPLFVVRVTRFANNSGLVICTACHHMVSDAYGWSLLLNAWAAFARGDIPLPPNHNRKLFNLSLEASAAANKARPPHDDQSIFTHEVNNKKVVIFKFSPESLELLKTTAGGLIAEEERKEKWFSTLDVVLMLMWRASVRARNIPHSKTIGMFSVVNMRPHWSNFPDNYFGNVFHASSLIIPADQVVNNTLGNVAAAYRQTVLAGKAKSIESFLGQTDDGTDTSIVNKDSNWISCIDFSSTDWTKVGYYDMNFGDGRPVRYRRYMYPIISTVTIFDTPPAPGASKGAIEVCTPIDEECYERFTTDEELMTYAKLIE